MEQELDPKFDAATADRDESGNIDPMARDGYLLQVLEANKALRSRVASLEVTDSLLATHELAIDELRRQLAEERKTTASLRAEIAARASRAEQRARELVEQLTGNCGCLPDDDEIQAATAAVLEHDWLVVKEAIWLVVKEATQLRRQAAGLIRGQDTLEPQIPHN